MAKSKVKESKKVEAVAPVKNGSSKSKSKDLVKPATQKVVKEKESKKSKKAAKVESSDESSDDSASDSDSDASASSSESESSEDEKPTKKPAANGKKAKAAESSSESDSDSDSSESEEETAKPKANGVKTNGAKKAAAKSDSESDSGSDSSDSDSDSESEAEKPAAKAANGKATDSDSDSDADSDDSSDSDSSSDEAEAAAPSKKRKAEDDVDASAKKAKTDGPSTLFAGSLSWGIDDNALYEAFKDFEGLTNARVVTDKMSGRSRGFGYVDFSDGESATKAYEAMQGQMLDGRAINLDYANSRPAEGNNQARAADRAQKHGDTRSPPSDTLFVGNLPWDVDQDVVTEFFGDVAEIASIRLPTDPDSGNLKGFGYVTFTSIDGATNALDAKNGAGIGNGRNVRNVRLDFAGSRPPREGGGGFGGGFGGGRGGGRGGRGGGRGGDRGGRGRGGGRGGFGGRGGNSSFSGTKISFD